MTETHGEVCTDCAAHVQGFWQARAWPRLSVCGCGPAGPSMHFRRRPWGASLLGTLHLGVPTPTCYGPLCFQLAYMDLFIVVKKKKKTGKI